MPTDTATPTVAERPAGPPPLAAPTLSPRSTRLLLRSVALGYLTLVLILPVGAVVWRAFAGGVAPVWQAVTTPDALHAFWLTVLIAAIAVSPVVIGLALILVYGEAGWLGGWLAEHGVQVIFSLPGMVIATVFVSLPYVVREVAPVLREVGTEQEEAAWTLGASPLRAFLRVTLPSIRWGLAYGVVLTTARALGEFGAVTIVSGRLAGQTETMTLFVENRFEGFDLVGAYAAALVLAGLALLILLAMTGLDRRGST